LKYECKITVFMLSYLYLNVSILLPSLSKATTLWAYSLVSKLHISSISHHKLWCGIVRSKDSRNSPFAIGRDG